MKTSTHEFDSLNQWALWSDADIEEIVTDETIKILEKAVDLLVDDKIQKKPIIDRNNFVRVVREMRQVYKVGSRALGKTILEASEYVDRGELEKARDVYDRFVATCKVPFYRHVAENQSRRLSQSDG